MHKHKQFIYRHKMCKNHSHTSTHATAFTNVVRGLGREVCDPCVSSPDSRCCPTGSVCVVSQGNGLRAWGEADWCREAGLQPHALLAFATYVCVCARVAAEDAGVENVTQLGSVCLYVHVRSCKCCCQQANCSWHAHTDYWSQKVKCTLCSFRSLEVLSTFSPPIFIFYIFLSVIHLCFFSLPDDFFLSLPPPSISDGFSRGVTHWASSHHVR